MLVILQEIFLILQILFNPESGLFCPCLVGEQADGALSCAAVPRSCLGQPTPCRYAEYTADQLSQTCCAPSVRACPARKLASCLPTQKIAGKFKPPLTVNFAALNNPTVLGAIYPTARYG